jgi:hypothetical protein
MTLINLDFENLRLIDKDVISEWYSLIIDDEDGNFSAKNQTLSFSFGNSEILAEFDLNVSGVHTYIPGGYLEPEENEVEITSIDVTINNLFIDDEKIDNSEIIKYFEVNIKNYLSEDDSLL